MDRQAALSRPELAAGSEESFEGWVRASNPRLRRLAFLLTGDLDQAEDLLQSAYAKLLPRWHRVSTYDSPEAYVRRVMVNLRTSWWRRSRDREWATDRIPEGAPRDSACGIGDAVAESQVLLTALRTLPERQRAAVVLRHWCDMSEVDTASLMRCSVGTVKSNTARGLAQLRTALSEPSASPPTRKRDLR